MVECVGPVIGAQNEEIDGVVASTDIFLDEKIGEKTKNDDEG
jgi:hypothetical protein